MPRFRFLLLTLLPVLPCGCGDSPKAPPDQNTEKVKAVKEPDGAAIAGLVKQLGSADFTEREAATKALKNLGFPALDALRTAARSTDAEVAKRAAPLVQIIDDGFDQLLADYRDYGLPLPPKDSKL